MIRTLVTQITAGRTPAGRTPAVRFARTITGSIAAVTLTLGSLIAAGPAYALREPLPNPLTTGTPVVAPMPQPAVVGDASGWSPTILLTVLAVVAVLGVGVALVRYLAGSRRGVRTPVVDL